MKMLVPIGIAVVFIGIILIVLGSLTAENSKSKVAVGGFIGFIPFGFANDKRLLWVVVGIMAAFLVFFLFQLFMLARLK